MAKIVVLATGGTIAGQGADANDGVAYQAAQIDVEGLLGGICGLQDLLGADMLQGEQVAQVNSKDMDFSIWQVLARRCTHWLAQPDVRAVLVTHGTDTLEETACFLQQALAAAPTAHLWQKKPVVLTCAMRPATARLSDGPQNLADALAVARDPRACAVMAVAAGSVHAADAVQKIHPYRLDAFSSGDAGLLAVVEEGHVRWLREPPGWPQETDGRLWQAMLHTAPVDWPWVEVLHSHAGADARALHALVQAGVQGVVLAGTGNATLHQTLEEVAPSLPAKNVALALAPRCTASAVVRSEASPADPAPLVLCATGKGGAATALPVSKARVHLVLRLLAARAGAVQAVS